MQYKNQLGVAVLAILLALCLVPGALALPNGVNTDAGTPVTKGFFAVQEIAPLGGRLSNLNATAETQTEAWQGFYGDVLGNITLDDASDSTLYNWLNATNGIVLTSRNSSVDFTTISAQNDCTIDESLTGTDSDRVNNTFNASSNTLFTIGPTTIPAGTACALNTYINSTAQSSSFEEIIVTDGSNSIYTTRIEDDLTGFDGQPHDFQLIVPDARNSTTSTYFFYAELQ